MDDGISVQSQQVSRDDSVLLDEYLAEMLRLRVLIDAEQIEIERLKGENQELKAETRAILTALKAAVGECAAEI